jgi:hypothetical protein
MTYVQVAQTAVPTDQKPSWYNKGYAAPVPSYGTAQSTFVGQYDDGGSTKQCRITVQSETNNLIDPAKQYRLTIEEVQP